MQCLLRTHCAHPWQLMRFINTGTCNYRVKLDWIKSFEWMQYILWTTTKERYQYHCLPHCSSKHGTDAISIYEVWFSRVIARNMFNALKIMCIFFPLLHNRDATASAFMFFPVAKCVSVTSDMLYLDQSFQLCHAIHPGKKVMIELMTEASVISLRV